MDVMPEKDVLGLDIPDEGVPLVADPVAGRRTIRVTIILLIVAFVMAAILYFLSH